MNEQDVMACDASGHFVWLVVHEVVPFVEKPGISQKSLIRSIERWCASGVLAPFCKRASNAQILMLVEAHRLKGFPPPTKEVYLIHREGLRHLNERPKAGRRPKATAARNSGR